MIVSDRSTFDNSTSHLIKSPQDLVKKKREKINFGGFSIIRIEKKIILKFCGANKISNISEEY